MSRRVPDRVHDFTDEDGAAVAQLRDEVPELVSGVGHGDGVAAVGDAVAGEDGDAFRRGQRLRIDAKFKCQGFVDADQAGGCNGGRLHARVEALRQAGIGVVERDQQAGEASMDAIWSGRRISSTPSVAITFRSGTRRRYGRPEYRVRRTRRLR